MRVCVRARVVYVCVVERQKGRERLRAIGGFGVRFRVGSGLGFPHAFSE